MRDFDRILTGGTSHHALLPCKISSKSENIKYQNCVWRKIFKKKLPQKFSFSWGQTYEGLWWIWSLISSAKDFLKQLIQQNFKLPNFWIIFQLFFRLHVKKRPNIGNFYNFWSNSLQNIVILHPKMLSGSWIFLGHHQQFP